MTLKEELEILRGEPIELKAGNPMDIPCIETSDSEKLCKHPVVSVHMTTYNHEPYIRQAIEGVMMQKTDFEFELIIGEDCSQDKTREICFEYQKKYPDKVRVLWSNENLYHIKGNSARCACRYRGEFVAFCEGDDYWIDPLKLQKQVDIMRKYPNVGFCFCNADILWERSGEMEHWRGSDAYVPGVIRGRLFHLYYLLGKDPCVGCRSEGFINTATVMFRRSVATELRKRFSIFSWQLMLGDKQLWLGLSALADVYYLKDIVSVYRKTGTGAMATRGSLVFRDSALIKIYFGKVFLGLRNRDVPAAVFRQAFYNAIGVQRLKSIKVEALYCIRLLRSGLFRAELMRMEFACQYLGMLSAVCCRVIQACFSKLAYHFRNKRVSRRIVELYSDCEHGVAGRMG